ncbi:hypothetical protein [Methanolobus halotolerans]|uniref:Uncharacterized protein n=1 Tax=Methanolobus halotolerans TaxID=2052935 RepID=A0A4E0Q8F1_9EURY|nr:hypothetical protein [Methanolobus halotolerans]TGC11076.1 hypothetical protein CUN85_02705 [Methanolobus halotolerans]
MNYSYQKKEALFAALAGVLYVISGTLHIVEGLGADTGFAALLFVQADILGGFCLAVIGMVFLYGLLEMRRGIKAGMSFAYVGILLSIIFMAVYLLIMGGNLLDSFIVPGDYEGWNIMESLRPGIYLGLLSLMAAFSWKGRFSSNGISVREEV